MATTNKKMMIGIQPTGWTNDDFQEIGDDRPYQEILQQMSQTGFEGGSTGHNYPRHLPSLLHEMSSRKLRICGTWFGTSFTTGTDVDAAFDEFGRQLKFLKAVGAKDVVVAELANAVNQVRTKAVLDDRPVMTGAEWYLLTRLLERAGRLARDSGMQLSYHPHVGTVVQTLEEAERLLESTSADDVGLCLDTAHLSFGGADQRDIEHFAAKYATRIKHVHLKNVRGRVLPSARSNRYSFYQAIRCGIFTVPGDPEGHLDLGPILQTLQGAGYDRWLVVEAEQDPAVANPLECAQVARAYLRNHLGY